MKNFYIVDTTLRDGEQTAGIAFLEEEKIQVAKKLDEAGIDFIEAGIPAMGVEEQNCMEKIINLNLNAPIIAWNRMNIQDINHSLDCGAKNIHISVPGSEVHVYKKLNQDYNWVIHQLQECLNYALEKGAVVSIGIEDASRSDIKFLSKILDIAEKFKVERVRYADTVGILDPFQAYEAIKEIREIFQGDIDFHAHNDFGMATANALSAYRAGAKHISCCVNGLGERAGNAPLEEIVMALKFILKRHTDFDTVKLMELSQLVEKISGEAIHDRKPIVGRKVFSHESGIHVAGILKDANTYEAFQPEEIGRQRDIVIGKFSGVSAIIHKLNELDIKVDKIQANILLKKIRMEYRDNKKLDIKKILAH